MSLCPEKYFKVEFCRFQKTNGYKQRITRSKGESDRLSLPMRSRSTRKDATSGRNGGTALSTSGWEHQQQMPTQMPHSTQSPEAASEGRTATAPMLPPGPHRPLTPRMPLPASSASSLSSSAPLFQKCKQLKTGFARRGLKTGFLL